MLNDLNRRFRFMIDENDPYFDCIYLLGTALDPNMRSFLSDDQKQTVLRNVTGTIADLVMMLLR